MKKLLFVSSLMFAGQLAFSQTDVFKNDQGIANNGYDLVAYHTQYEAVRGTNEFSVEHGGATYYFSNEANQKAFESNPSSYLPAYGGYCAFGVGKMNAKVPTNPTTFKLRDGKLYLFFNDFYEGKPFNTIVPWNQHEQDMIEAADAAWVKIK